MRSSIIIMSLLFLLSCKQKQEPVLDENSYYTCSMDPQVISNKPGLCPICKMDLTLVTHNKNAKQGEIELSDQQIILGNIHTDTIRTGTLGNSILLTATLNIDESTVRSINSRIEGRIDRLYFRNEGEFIGKGEPIFDLYSEALNGAKQEFLALKERRQVLDSSIVDFESLIQRARTKLLLWGMSNQQIDALKAGHPLTHTTFYSTEAGYISNLAVQEGEYVMEGQQLFRLAKLDNLWAEAQVYSSQMSGINANSQVEVQIPDMNGEVIKGKLEFINPEISPDTRINLIRVTIPNLNNRLKPGMPAYVVVKGARHNSIMMPANGVVRDGKSAYVWVRTGTNSFLRKKVTTGVDENDEVEILDGLSLGDEVVVSGAYLLYSEMEFRPAHNH